MGMFSNITNFASKKIAEIKEDREDRDTERRLNKLAVHEERMRSAPELARKQVKQEHRLALRAQLPSSKKGGFLGNLQSSMAGMGQSNADFFGVGSGSKKKSSGFSMGHDYGADMDNLLGKSPKRKTGHKKKQKDEYEYIRVKKARR